MDWASKCDRSAPFALSLLTFVTGKLHHGCTRWTSLREDSDGFVLARWLVGPDDYAPPEKSLLLATTLRRHWDILTAPLDEEDKKAADAALRRRYRNAKGEPALPGEST